MKLGEFADLISVYELLTMIIGTELRKKERVEFLSNFLKGHDVIDKSRVYEPQDCLYYLHSGSKYILRHNGISYRNKTLTYLLRQMAIDRAINIDAAYETEMIKLKKKGGVNESKRNI